MGHGLVLPEQLWPPLGPGSSEPGSGQLVEGRELAWELGVCSPWLICSRPARAIISASLSQVEEWAQEEEGCTEEDMMGGGSSSLLGSTAWEDETGSLFSRLFMEEGSEERREAHSYLLRGVGQA